MRVLSILCHPDDMELTCAGTLIKCRKRGDDVFACHLANGNMGHEVIPPDELREIRTREAENAGKLAGFEVINGDIGDLTLNGSDFEQVKKVIRIIRYVRPDMIITHDPADYCSDHTEVYRLVFNASFSASCPHFHPELGGATKVTPIYFAETSYAVNAVYKEYVDITEEMDLKMEMLACHKSQIDWLRDHDRIDVIHNETIKAADRGIQCGVKYAEGFNQLLAAQRLVPYRMLP
ncbi:MAG: PIG-L family deacetylase [Clostridia bacterium]|nr:PIG-L family deacetylase [Clostridia bacterium]